MVEKKNDSLEAAIEPPSSALVLNEIAKVLAERKNADPKLSYVASLYHKGLNKILEKIGEEATEVILAAKDYSKQEAISKKALVGEMADLWFHCLILLEHLEIPLSHCFAELESRQGLSGHTEKAQRNQHK